LRQQLESDTCRLACDHNGYIIQQVSSTPTQYPMVVRSKEPHDHHKFDLENYAATFNNHKLLPTPTTKFVGVFSFPISYTYIRYIGSLRGSTSFLIASPPCFPTPFLVFFTSQTVSRHRRFHVTDGFTSQTVSRHRRFYVTDSFTSQTVSCHRQYSSYPPHFFASLPPPPPRRWIP